MAVTMANVLLIATFTFAEFFVWLALVPFIDWGGLLLLTVDTTAFICSFARVHFKKNCII